MPIGTIKDLGAWAEDDFSGQCAKEGVTRNKAHQDRHGWDYLVEFPSRGMPHVPADRWPADVSARVQVKSKEKGKPFVDLKLSNAQRFAKEPGACFLILYVATDGGEPVRIYARHFWKDEIALVLKRVREAHDVGRDDLHKLKVRLNFAAGDEHTEDLVAWMAGTVVGRPRYLNEKQTLIHTVGFEAGSGGFHGSLSFAADDLAALVDHQIGVRDIAPPLTITMTERRFGIDAKVPILSGTPDAAHLRSHPVPCRLRVRPPEGADLWLDGELFQPAFTDLPPDLWKVRVVADFIELIINGKGEGTATLKRDVTHKRNLASHRAFTEVVRLAAIGPLKLMLASDVNKNLPISVALDGVEANEALQQFSNVITCLEKASAGILPEDLTLSQAEIDAAWNAIVDFNGMVTGTDFRGQFELEAAPPDPLSKPDAIFFYDYVEIGDCVFGAVVRRPIAKFEIYGQMGQMDLGPARVVEAIARRGDGPSILGELQMLYKQAYVPEQKSAIELMHGSYQGLLAMSRKDFIIG